jgi:hypothetical protein
MPEGPFGGPRVTNLGPLSRSTVQEVRSTWDECPEAEKSQEICRSIKYHSLSIIKNQDIFPDCDDIESINEGRCYDIATKVLDDVDGIRIFKVGDYDHVWIVHNGKHYDAEKPSGVDEYMELPFFEFPLQALLRFARQAAIANNEQPPETLEETIVDVTDEYK